MKTILTRYEPSRTERSWSLDIPDLGPIPNWFIPSSFDLEEEADEANRQVSARIASCVGHSVRPVSYVDFAALLGEIALISQDEGDDICVEGSAYLVAQTGTYIETLDIQDRPYWNFSDISPNRYSPDGHIPATCTLNAWVYAFEWTIEDKERATC